ncbi:MAG: hypothetical protein BWK80_51610 [Desulfobacteraceae bacterium IS3]|nr:MAG: hypothetical protein BWK80_51610 [Desulfobacteraceae bacterium IS3]
MRSEIPARRLRIITRVFFRHRRISRVRRMPSVSGSSVSRMTISGSSCFASRQTLPACAGFVYNRIIPAGFDEDFQSRSVNRLTVNNQNTSGIFASSFLLCM